MIGKEYRWFAIYVIRNHERRVNDWLGSMGLEVLFPTNRVRKVWSDRVQGVTQYILM